MKSSAVRRIGRRLPGKSRNGPTFPQLVVLSLAIHAAVLFALGYFPGGRERRRAVEMFSVTLTELPGPMGGGGESSEVVKPPEKKEKKPPPEKETVKVAKRPEEKKPVPEAKKKPEEPLPAKVPEMSKGPGQGPVGGGGKKGMTRGPITLEGGVEFPFGFYLDALQKKVERNWDPPNIRTKNAPKVVVFFLVDRSGNITDVNVETSSGMDLFDQKAVVAVKRSMPLPPLPAGFKGDSLGVHYIFIPEAG